MRYLITDKQYEQLISMKLRRLPRTPQMLDYVIDKAKQQDIKNHGPYIKLVRDLIRHIINKYFYNNIPNYTLVLKGTPPNIDDAWILADRIVRQNYRYISKSFYKKN